MEVGKAGQKDNGKKELTKSSQIIKLIRYNPLKNSCSNDGQIFYANKDVVQISKLLKSQLNSQFVEAATHEVSLDIPGQILEICLKYLHYKVILASISLS